MTQAPSSICNTLWAMSLEAELPGRAHAQEYVFPATSRTGSRNRCQGLNMEILSFPFQALILGNTESAISRSRARGRFQTGLAPAFSLNRNAQNLFFLDHTCLTLKGCLLTPEPPYFLKCYSLLDLAPKTEANVILHIQQVIFQRTSRACYQSLIFPRKFKSHSRSKVQCPISERTLPKSRVGNTLRCTRRSSHGYSANVY